MMEQAEMDLKERTSVRESNADLAARMLAVLAAANRWMKREDLARHGIAKRQCSKGRQYSKGGIIYGQRGFRASSQASQDELKHAARTLHSQATVMLKEEQELWRYFHGRG